MLIYFLFLRKRPPKSIMDAFTALPVIFWRIPATGDFAFLRIIPGTGRPHPGIQLFLHCRVLPKDSTVCNIKLIMVFSSPHPESA
jgi:hypothetical protein